MSIFPSHSLFLVINAQNSPDFFPDYRLFSHLGFLPHRVYVSVTYLLRILALTMPSPIRSRARSRDSHRRRSRSRSPHGYCRRSDKDSLFSVRFSSKLRPFAPAGRNYRGRHRRPAPGSTTGPYSYFHPRPQGRYAVRRCSLGMIEIHENLFRFLEFHGYLPSGYSNYSIIDHLFGISIQHIPMDKGLTESIILTRIGIPWSFVHWSPPSTPSPPG